MMIRDAPCCIAVRRFGQFNRDPKDIDEKVVPGRSVLGGSRRTDAIDDGNRVTFSAVSAGERACWAKQM
jgi:hypothetical protein